MVNPKQKQKLQRIKQTNKSRLPILKRATYTPLQYVWWHKKDRAMPPAAKGIHSAISPNILDRLGRSRAFDHPDQQPVSIFGTDAGNLGNPNRMGESGPLYRTSGSQYQNTKCIMPQ